MFFDKKPLLCFQLSDKSARYLAVHPKNHSILEKGKIVFETPILEDGRLVTQSMLETRLDILVKEKKWKNAKAHVLLLNDFVTIREETVPGQLTSGELKSYLELHMNQSIRIPIENPVFDFGVIEKNSQEQKIFIIAYPRHLVNQYQELFQHIGLRPVLADVAALSLYRVADRTGTVVKDKAHHTLLVEWNPYSMSLMVFNEDRPTFNRHSQLPHLAEAWKLTQEGEWIWQQPAVELERMLEDQFNSLERFLDFYQYSVLNGEGSISEMVLTGHYPDLVFLKKQLRARFSQKTSLLDFPEGIEKPFGALYGLTLREEIGGRYS